MNEKQQLILKAYELLDRATPLRTDCGRMCGKICCKGDGDLGMWLFPGEEELFLNNKNFIIKECDGNFGYKLIVCNGDCNRNERPLSCRIFPFFPMADALGFDVRADIRGISICPLLQKNIRPDYTFIRQLRKAARLLSQNEDIKKYICDVNSMLDDIGDMAERAE